MEWNSKLPSWDFADLEQNAELNMWSLIGPSVVFGGQSRGADCSVDLKLGGLGVLRPSDKWKATQPAMGAAAAPPRRARPPGNGGGQVAACSVDGCRSDLSNSREYHRRHKVCEAHSKTPVVMVGGQEQRFCQQCSRFHQLVEFDEVKRSCRKRLDGHNRRRRKPQPDSTNPRSLFPDNQAGNKFFMYPHLIPSPIHDHNWPGLIKTEGTAYTAPHFPSQVTETQQHSSSSFSSSKNMQHFPFLQPDNTMTAFIRTTTTTMAQSAFQPFLKAPPSPQSSRSSSRRRVLPDSAQIFGADCARSLLSSAQNPGALLSTGQMLPAGRIPLRHRSVISQAGVETAGLVCDADHAGLHQYQCVLSVTGEEGSSEEASHALPFYWQ